MSNMKNEQVQAMNDYLHDDTVARLKSMTKYWECDNEDKSSDPDGKLNNLLVQLGSGTSNSSKLIMDKNVMETIREVGKDICHRNGAMVWTIELQDSILNGEHEKILMCYERRLRETLKIAARQEDWTDEVHCSRGSSAVFSKPKGEFGMYQRQCKLVPYDVVEVSCSAITEEHGTVYRRSNLSGERFFIRVLGFLHTLQNGRTVDYCVGQMMKKCKETLEGDTSECTQRWHASVAYDTYEVNQKLKC